MNKKEELKKIFGIKEFRVSQEKIIDDVISGKNCLVVMPTGMGKSFCYQLPALILDGLTIVISPLIALMEDQVQKLKNLGIDADFINSSLSKSERNKKYEKLHNGFCKILYVSPERFRKLDFMDAIQKRKIALLAIDEAHCISQWGHDFRPDYTKIAEFRSWLNHPVTMLLTATATYEVRKDMIQQTGIPEKEMNIYNEGICRPNLYLAVYSFLDESEKFGAIISSLIKNKGTTIVYFNLIKNLEKFSHLLDIQKIPHDVYHGRLPSNIRKKVLKNFIKDDNNILLATNAFGMGIDKSNIRTVIHAELPSSVESYYQEIGRAGRDGKPANCLVFYNQDDLTVLMDFIDWQNPDEKFMKKAFQVLKGAGESLSSLQYEDLQSMLVHKNRGDHRLQTVLNLFSRYNVTTGDLENHNLEVIGDLPESLILSEKIEERKKLSFTRLYQMLQYIKTENCRRAFVYNYFNAELKGCDNCDFCRQKYDFSSPM